jgi:hypothetical protein
VVLPPHQVNGGAQLDDLLGHVVRLIMERLDDGFDCVKMLAA